MSPEEINQAAADMRALLTDDTLYTIHLPWQDAWALLCAVQLATRHPSATQSPLMQRAIEAAQQIQHHISHTPAIAHLADLGWLPQHDQPTT